MCDVISQSNGKTREKKRIIVDGNARLSFVVDADGLTQLGDLYQRDPQRILFPNAPKGDIIQAVVVTTSGGLVGGDKISVTIKVGENAKALVTAQAAEKIYRSTGADVEINVSLIAESGSWFEFLPQETILFDRSRLRRKIEINVAKGGKLLAGEMMVFGRLGHGEHFQTGLVHDSWEVSREDRLVWADSLHLESNIATILDDPACFNGAVAMATAVYVGPDVKENLFVAREIFKSQESSVLSGASIVNGILLLRWLGKDALALRDDFGFFWGAFRNKVASLPTELPRLWNM
ncbi:MAG: urease accessory protein UreD [Rhodospirillales bacterium]|jgi:urease accessory protein